MPDQSLFSLASTCPRCHQAPILAGLVKMNHACTACGLTFEQEEGQNWGSMFVAYVLGGLIVIPLFFVLVLRHASLPVVVGVPLAILIVIAPLNVRLSRLIWTHVMYHMRASRRS